MYDLHWVLAILLMLVSMGYLVSSTTDSTICFRSIMNSLYVSDRAAFRRRTVILYFCILEGDRTKINYFFLQDVKKKKKVFQR